MAVGLAAAILFGPAAATAKDDELTFVVLGDMPYDGAQEATLKGVIAPAIRLAEFRFLIHLGDTKGGGVACTDWLLEERRDQIYRLVLGGIFYTPGDNDWTDCDRPSTGDPRLELERLDFLRRLYFPAHLVLPQTWDYEVQPGFPENARWTADRIVFATAHVVGTNNGRRDIWAPDPGGTWVKDAPGAYLEEVLDRVDERDRANLAWLDAAFALAREWEALAVVIAIQADVTDVENSEPCTRERRQECDGFAGFRDRLVALAADFAKPVLLIHGDTAPFCLDRAFGGARAPKLWRLNAAGDYAVLDATVVIVQRSEKRPFVVTRLLTGAQLGDADAC